MKERIRRFILGESEDLVHGLDFEAVALSLYRWQRANNPDYDAFCGEANPKTWREIPAVPVTLFRDLPLCCFEPSEARVHFRTSGTTGRRGTHRLLDTDLYDLASRRHAEQVIGCIPSRGISLVSHAEDSSLGHMCRHFVGELPSFFDPELGLRQAEAWNAIRASTAPVFIPMTGLAAAALIENVERPHVLPQGSRVMVTGGFKGREAAVDAETLVSRLESLFPGADLVGEYGMTELSSQLWSATLGDPFVPPPWMRVLAVDPWTGEPAEEGLLRFFDLANHQSVLAIETGDVGRVLADGRVELRGRLPGAEARGCSLSFEEAQQPKSIDEPPRLPVVDPAAGGGPEGFDLHDERCGQRKKSVVEADDTVPAHPLISAPDEVRIAQVLTALAALRREDPSRLGDGLSRSQVMGTLGMAIDAITRDGLVRELAQHPERPEDVTLVAARGVFTAPLEWVALYAAAGIRVHIKAPRGAAQMCQAIARTFQAQDLPVHVREDRALGNPSTLVAFGSDESLDQISRSWPQAHHVLFGHRFSVAITGTIAPQILAWEVAYFDTRGCMAPVAIFCLDDPSVHLDALTRSMAAAQRAMPRGKVEGALGPEWRRRIGLARRKGRVREGEGWAIVQLPSDDFTPTALPRMMCLYTISGPEELRRVLGAWRGQLSTMGTDNLLRPRQDRNWADIYSWFPRCVSLGQMQRPILPRLHDGVEMLGSICRKK